MQYFITFLEGIISFISPCMLPMLPVYVSYFALGKSGKKAFVNSLFFVAGFTLVFCLLGVFAGSVGSLMSEHMRVVNIVCGLVIIVLALSFLDIIKIPFFRGAAGGVQIKGMLSSFLFGMVFSVSLTPCVGAFLGSALMMASSSATALEGAMLLLAYSLGLGVPFVVSAVFIDKLKGFFDVIKKHYRVINIVCALFLILVGIMMMTGNLSRLLAVFS
ncbi:MAG: sulfite exporter TauE/SafE family protein [Clostridia bacterium]|nr:sulfite exporter TauE/SafE family protein [Clostridia bacterium]